MSLAESKLMTHQSRITPYLYIQGGFVESYMDSVYVCQPKLSLCTVQDIWTNYNICLKVPCCCSSVACRHRTEINIEMEELHVCGTFSKPGKESGVLLTLVRVDYVLK